MRLDKYILGKLGDVSRSKIQSYIKSGYILVNGKIVKVGYELKESDDVSVDIPKKEDLLTAEEGELEILYEDKDCFVVNKPAGMVVHPGEGGSHLSGTLANLVKDKVKVGVGDYLRPGIVHRLDKDTSGILVIAKTKKGYESLIKQFKERKVKKNYYTLVCGEMKDNEGIIKASIGRSVFDRKKMSIVGGEGKEAISKYKVIDCFSVSTGRKVSFLDVEILTGRTHQIRLHMKAVGHPVIADIVYGNKDYNRFFEEKFGLKRQFLHAYKLSFVSPSTGKVVMVKEVLSKDLDTVLKQLKQA